MSQPGMISHGLPPRDNDVQRAIADLQRQVNQMSGALVQAANTANHALSQMSAYSFYGQSFNPDPSSSRLAINGSVTTPAGFTKLAFFGTCVISAINNSGITDTLEPVISVGYGSTYVVPDGYAVQQATNGDEVAVTQGIAGVLTGLPAGQVIQVKAYGVTAYNTWTSQSFAGFNILTIWQP